MEMKLGFDVQNISNFKKGVLLVLPAIAIIAIFVTLFIMPQMEEHTKLKSEVSAQNNEINLLKIHAERLPTLIAENERLQKRLVELQMQLPEEKDITGLLKQVSILGTQAGLEVTLWKPKARNVHETKEVYEIPVEVQMKGGYHQFGYFFGNLTRLSRVVNLNDLNIKTLDPKIQKLGKELNAGFTALTYSVISEEEKKTMEEKEKEKTKEKK